MHGYDGTCGLALQGYVDPPSLRSAPEGIARRAKDVDGAVLESETNVSGWPVTLHATGRIEDITDRSLRVGQLLPVLKVAPPAGISTAPASYVYGQSYSF